MRRVMACPRLHVALRRNSAARAKTTGHHPLTDGQVEDARQALVTGYAEYRASLQDKKQYRRAIKSDLKLP